VEEIVAGNGSELHGDYGGPHGGNTSVYLTLGIVLGRFRIHNRFAFAIGGGYQLAVTQFDPTNHIAIFSVRLPF
jgi:hypothetical protein